jgi:hypothetical protein
VSTVGLGKKLPADFFTSNLPSRKNIPCTHVIYRLFTSNLPHHMIASAFAFGKEFPPPLGGMEHHQVE